MWLFLLLFVALPLFFLLLQKRHNEQFNHPPGPKGLPFIGNLHQFDAKNPHLYLSTLAKIYGPILFLRLGRVPTVVISSAKLAKEVLKTQDHDFCSRPSMVGQQKLSYNGLDIAFAPYNAYFREIRKISVVHLFSSKRVLSFAPIRQDEISRMIDKISSLASDSNVVNLSDLLMALTSSITCRVAFGKRCEDEGIEKSRFHTLLNETQALFVAFFFSDYLPLMGWLDKVTGLSSRLERVFKDMDAFYEELINDHLHQDKSESDREDLIDVLLQLRKERCFAFELTLDHIKAVLMIIFVAGTDTSAAMVVWAMTELMKNTMVMRKVQVELRTTIRYRALIKEDDLPKLEYFKAVVKETFRLHPAAPLLVPHETIQKCKIDGYDIQPKTTVFVNAWAIGRDLESWKNPDIFIPERFLGSSIDFKGNDFELIPFGAGRRMCPGMLLGAVNFELALANLLYCFDWELPVGMGKEDIDTDVIPGLTMHKKTPLCLVAKKFQ